MKHYEITVENGHYPLTYKCSTIAEAYGCIETLRYRLLRSVAIDMSNIMETLVQMKNGHMLGTQTSSYSIRVLDGEI